jgi:predicted transposase/invertase (TIGR01784 family)
MRRDSIFYQLFQQSPMLLFELLDSPPINAQNYRFDSVAVKEPKFEIDGVFLPPQMENPGIVYFCEVQFQKDELLYERLFGESFLYFYRNRTRFSDWQAVVIYPSRSVEQSNTFPYQDLLNGDRLHRVYLDELGEIGQLPLGVALMSLTTVDETNSPAIARLLLSRARQEELSLEARRVIMDMVTTIMVYRFTTLSRREIEVMLGLDLQQSRVYQEAKAEGERSLILRLLNRKVGEIPDAVLEAIDSLSISQLETLGEALLDFGSIADLESWLAAHA